MSELDLGSTSTPAATTAAAPAPAAAGTGLVLAPPAPVAVVEPQQAAGAIPVDPAKQTELQAKAAAFAAELANMDTRSPAFTQKIDSITSMGDKDMRATAQVSSRMLDRPAAVMKAGKGGGGGDAQSRISPGPRRS
jgi:Skp family chaperone for outer membrane proteins